MTHVVIEDGGTYPRWTCQTCLKQVVRQPYMTDAVWDWWVRKFKHEHPS